MYNYIQPVNLPRSSFTTGTPVNDSSIITAQTENLFLNAVNSVFSSKSAPVQYLGLINIIIFFMWSFNNESEFMLKNFISSPQNRKMGYWWSDFLSSFSQIEPYHLAGNLAALTIFGPPSVTYLGEARFYSFVTLSVLLGNWFQGVWRNSQFAIKRIKSASSLGFSGINSALFVIYAIYCPENLISYDNKTLSAKDALVTAICGDFVGWIFDALDIFQSPIGHFAHLSGYMSGFLLYKAVKLEVYITRFVTKIYRRFRPFQPQLSFTSNFWADIKTALIVMYISFILFP